MEAKGGARYPRQAVPTDRAINSAARVPPLHGGSRGFESLIAYHRPSPVRRARGARPTRRGRKARHPAPRFIADRGPGAGSARVGRATRGRSVDGSARTSQTPVDGPASPTSVSEPALQGAHGQSVLQSTWRRAVRWRSSFGTTATRPARDASHQTLTSRDPRAHPHRGAPCARRDPAPLRHSTDPAAPARPRESARCEGVEHAESAPCASRSQSRRSAAPSHACDAPLASDAQTTRCSNAFPRTTSHACAGATIPVLARPPGRFV